MSVSLLMRTILINRIRPMLNLGIGQQALSEYIRTSFSFGKNMKLGQNVRLWYTLSIREVSSLIMENVYTMLLR